jgi:hypothetical protein
MNIIYCILGFLVGASFGIYLYIDGARRWGWNWMYREIKEGRRK